MRPALDAGVSEGKRLFRRSVDELSLRLLTDRTTANGLNVANKRRAAERIVEHMHRIRVFSQSDVLIAAAESFDIRLAWCHRVLIIRSAMKDSDRSIIDVIVRQEGG